MNNFNRRNFIKTSVLGGIAISSPMYWLNGAPSVRKKSPESLPTRVSVSTANDRADLTFKALQPFSREIRQAIGNKMVVLKPNNVLIYVPLAATHVETLEGVLEFLKSINKDKNVIIAESSASGSTLEGFDNYGYYSLLKKYPVKLVDLDAGPSENMYVTDERDFKPHLIKVSGIATDKNSYLVSVARMKTHTSVGATLSLKNIVFGVPIKDNGFMLYNEDKRFSDKAKESKSGAVSWKRLIHGSGMHAVNYNMALLAQKLHPDLAIIDGFIGMEGNGPTLGTPIEHKVCVVSQDWLAADRIGAELMGIDPLKIGYLNHSASMGLGNFDRSSYEIIGENIKDHIKSYQLPKNFDSIISWMNPKTS
jgi:uncharacterized protein (DUF362 family)